MHCGDGVGRRRRALRAHVQPSVTVACFDLVRMEQLPRSEGGVEGEEVANRRDAGVALDHLALQ